MKPTEIEGRMRQLKCFHGIRLLPGAWTVLRLDGRGFSRFTESRFEKPFDEHFHQLMTGTAQRLLEELQGIYAYTESDEISVLFRPQWDLFDRELEKLVSLSAGLASAAFSLAVGELAQFDSRVWLGPRRGHVIDYFRWRQADATRCALNGWCYWTLRKAGHTVGQATNALLSKGRDDKNEILFRHGINFNDLPLWQRRGTGLYWEEYDKQGFNPREQKTVRTRRRRVHVDRELPMREEYSEMLRRIMKSARPSGQARSAVIEDA